MSDRILNQRKLCCVYFWIIFQRFKCIVKGFNRLTNFTGKEGARNSRVTTVAKGMERNQWKCTISCQ